VELITLGCKISRKVLSDLGSVIGVSKVVGGGSSGDKGGRAKGQTIVR